MDNKDIILRKIEKRDNAEIAEVIRTVFREFGIDRPGTVYFDPTTDDLFKLFGVEGSVYFIAESEGRIVGGCGIYPTPDLPEGCAELVKFYLLPELRGKGIGKILMDKAFESARQMGYRQIYLESMPELSKAIGMYQKSGFRFIDHRMGNSGHFNCEIWMIRDL
jgi:putative acetyltransferase